MSLRITQGMMYSQLSRNLNQNLSQMQNLQEETTTGRKINKPSDDPVGITYALRYRTELSSNEQYQENADSAHSWLDFNDTVLSQAGDILKRVKELAVQGSNGTNPQVALDNIKDEVSQLKEQLVDIANSKLNGKYVFNGQTFDQMPYDKSAPGFDAKAVVTDSGDVSYTVGAGVTLPVNLSGNQVFGSPGDSDNVFGVLDNIMSALSAGNQSAVAAQLGNLDSSTNRVLSAGAEVGARVNRVELMQSRLDDLKLNLTGMQTNTEDADYDQLIIDAKVNQNIYQASLSVGAKIITPSLVDFLN